MLKDATEMMEVKRDGTRKLGAEMGLEMGSWSVVGFSFLIRLWKEWRLGEVYSLFRMVDEIVLEQKISEKTKKRKRKKRIKHTVSVL